jgi:hypothetical protein
LFKGTLGENRHLCHSDPNLVNWPDLVSLGPNDNVKQCNKPASVAHTSNPSYLGGWDQEDPDLKSAQVKSSQNPISTNGWHCHLKLQEAEMRRIVVSGQSGQNKIWETPISTGKKSWVPVTQAMAGSIK